MARSELALRRARLAYERTYVVSGLRALAVAAVLVISAIALHRTTDATWLVASTLAATLATMAWRGGGWKRGGLAGVLAGIPVFVAPAVYFMATTGGHCPDCNVAPSLPCMMICFGTSAAAGLLVGRVASHDSQPRRFALGALSTALLTGLLGCGTVGFGGALGVAIGLAAGGVTGWVAGNRTARA